MQREEIKKDIVGGVYGEFFKRGDSFYARESGYYYIGSIDDYVFLKRDELYTLNQIKEMHKESQLIKGRK